MRGLHVDELANTVSYFVELADFERKVHTAGGAKLIDEHLRIGMAFDVLKKKGWTSGGVGSRVILTYPVSDLGDLQDRIHFRTDFLQFAGAVERGDPIT